MAKNKKKKIYNKKITFEDHGQDFNYWIVSPDGKVVDCQPFQFSVWGKVTVLSKRFRVGSFVSIHSPSAGFMQIKYPIKKVEKVLAEEQNNG